MLPEYSRDYHIQGEILTDSNTSFSLTSKILIIFGNLSYITYERIFHVEYSMNTNLFPMSGGDSDSRELESEEDMFASSRINEKSYADYAVHYDIDKWLLPSGLSTWHEECRFLKVRHAYSPVFLQSTTRSPLYQMVDHAGHVLKSASRNDAWEDTSSVASEDLGEDNSGTHYASLLPIHS